MSKVSHKTTTALKHLAELTAIYDIDIFELSLFQTLAELVSIESLSIFQFNRNDNYWYQTKIPNNLFSVEASKNDLIEIANSLSSKQISSNHAFHLAREWITEKREFYCTEVDSKLLQYYPIKVANQNSGFLQICFSEKPRDTEIQVITSLLAISDNYHLLLADSQTDKLTGLLNRKTLDDNIYKIKNILKKHQTEFKYDGKEQRIPQLSQEYWLAIIDIDNFKLINDKFGHIYGDEVLLLLAQLMKKTFRPIDLLFRYGGEEFVIILQVEDYRSATLVLDRLRQVVESSLFPQVGKVTISLGATKLVNIMDTTSTIVGRADEALYYAKTHGKNQLFFYEDLLAKGILKPKQATNSVELF